MATETESEGVFTKSLKIWLTPDMDAWLKSEAARRLNLLSNRREDEGLKGLRSEARADNLNINKGMLIREAVHRLMEQTKP